MFSFSLFVRSINKQQQQLADQIWLEQQQKLSHQDNVYHFDDSTTSDSSLSALCSIFAGTGPSQQLCKRIFDSLANKMKLFFIFDRLEWDEYVRIFYTHTHARAETYSKYKQKHPSIHPPNHARQMFYFRWEKEANFSPPMLLLLPVMVRFLKLYRILKSSPEFAYFCALQKK